MVKVLLIAGTRPEVIKLCPVAIHLREFADKFQVSFCSTGQHRELLEPVLDAFGVKPDFHLDLMQPGQTLFQLTGRILAALEEVLSAARPDIILVQGDTTTCFCGAMAGFYAGIPVGHVEAGLRTGDMRQPFPEEMNRVLATRLTTLHFAPTEESAANLIREGISAEYIHVTGNTGIDALLHVSRTLKAEPAKPSARKTILVTAHRRESFGEGFSHICTALRTIAERSDVEVIYPVHPNPNVRGPVYEKLDGVPNIRLIEPQDYVPFVGLMMRSHLILTDSGGIQEEAPSLGKPVLVMREKTERPEAVAAGTSRLVGVDPDKIVTETNLLLDDAAEYDRRRRIHNPYGTGDASAKIRQAIEKHFHR
ncbi:MAG: UDP-N-acetylglucosamine 2-epimerase (non-hydrolyzing) [Candidatus Solibacter usitatus]|nr:UDP-N-acetylglucosamine 2-epimerase (non-hydrolyzing) [Candidatus Solibacter usitatus]